MGSVLQKSHRLLFVTQSSRAGLCPDQPGPQTPAKQNAMRKPVAKNIVLPSELKAIETIKNVNVMKQRKRDNDDGRREEIKDLQAFIENSYGDDLEILYNACLRIVVKLAFEGDRNVRWLEGQVRRAYNDYKKIR
jgi:hypothetical protein